MILNSKIKKLLRKLKDAQEMFMGSWEMVGWEWEKISEEAEDIGGVQVLNVEV